MAVGAKPDRKESLEVKIEQFADLTVDAINRARAKMTDRECEAADKRTSEIFDEPRATRKPSS